MIIKDVTQVGNPIIRKKSKIVKDIRSEEIKQLVEDLTDSMRDARLVGMAAPQIGINLRVFVTEIRVTDTRSAQIPDPVRVFINPKILSLSKKQVEIYEGCGSVAHADLFSSVRRPETVIVEAVDVHGEKFILETGGLLARIIQHEIDHLDGKVFLDRISDTTTLTSKNEYMKMVGKK
ncbi:MAG: peptide deformylase [Candidatus Gracilibacteria bacterium]